MLKWLIIGYLLVSVAAQNCIAQDKTTGERNSLLLSSEAQKEFLIVPMMDKMFLSNVSHEIGKYNGMNFREVRSFFRDYITEMTALSSLANWQMTSLDETSDTLARNVHVAQRFDYELIKVHTKTEESKIQEIWHHLQKKEEKQSQPRGAYLENGEIKEFYDGKSRFMNAQVDTSWVFGNVLSDFDFDYLLFINELDINKPRPTDPNYGTSERTIKLHFTLYSSEGKRLYGNAAFSTFEENDLDIYGIANNALFSAINRMLAECSAELTLLSEKQKVD